MDSVRAIRGLLIDAEQYKKSADKKNCLIKLMAIGIPVIILITVAYFIFDAVRTK